MENIIKKYLDIKLYNNDKYLTNIILDYCKCECCFRLEQECDCMLCENCNIKMENEFIQVCDNCGNLTCYDCEVFDNCDICENTVCEHCIGVTCTCGMKCSNCDTWCYDCGGSRSYTYFDQLIFES